jgi:hypothetical protein
MMSSGVFMQGELETEEEIEHEPLNEKLEEYKQVKRESNGSALDRFLGRKQRDAKWEVRLESPDNAGARIITLPVEAPDEASAKRQAEQDVKQYSRKPYPTAVKATKVSDRTKDAFSILQWLQKNNVLAAARKPKDFKHGVFGKLPVGGRQRGA